MRELSIGALDAGQRLDKYLMRIFKEADRSFLYRMLRKKNITLNGKKAQGAERLAEGDTVYVFFSEETYAKMQGKAEEEKRAPSAFPPVLDILFENDHILVINKPAGLLSQKAEAKDDSLSDRIAAYVREKGLEGSAGFKPSAANRLDRNTSGLVLAGKTLPGQQLLSFLLREGLLEKYYVCLVKGRLAKPLESLLFWEKQEADNTVRLREHPSPGAAPVRLRAESLEPLREGTDCLKVQLISGKSHQIRAQLAFLGHPILGDAKYGEALFNRELSFRLGIALRLQLLHSHQILFPPFQEQPALSETALKIWQEMAGRSITAPLPPYFKRVLGALGGSYGE